MATQKIRIAELEIDDKALIASTAALKKNIDELKQSQKELTKDGLSSSKQFVQNAGDLKTLNSAYNANVKALSQRTQATADSIVREELMNTVLNEEVKTIKEARDQNKLLNKLRNETNTTTEQGVKELKALNDALDSNNEYIKENADQYLKQKINIGNYTDSIKDAIINGDNLGDSLIETGKGFVGLAKSSLLFLATPIGLVVAALGAAFLLVKNAMNRSEEATNKITKVFSAFSGIVNKLLSALEPLGDFLIDGIVVYFELVGEAAEKALSVVSDALSFLGFEDASKAVDSFSESMKEGIKQSQALADAEAKLTKVQREAQKVQLDYQKDAEKLRQIRDDENLSIKERMKANEELGVVLRNQLASELEIAEQALIVANLRIKAEGETKDALDRQAEALTTISDIQERITGQESEQLVNRVSLQKEARDKAKEFADKAIAEQEALLEKFIQSQGIRKKSTQEQLDFEQTVFDKQKSILDENLKNRNLTQTEYDAELLALQNDLAQSRTDLLQTEYQRELDLFIANNESKLDNEKYFSDESLRIEQERINAIDAKQKEFVEKQLQDGVINQQEYNDAINVINEENRIRLEEAQIQRDEAQKEKEVIDLENKRILDEEKFVNEFEKEREKLELKKQQELEVAEKTGADLELIKEKYKKANNEIDQAEAETKYQSIATVAGQASEVLGKESALGKIAALTQAGINIQLGITKAIAQGGLAGIATGALVAAKGAVSISKIAGANTKFEQGGIQEVGGKRHSQGGTKFYGEDGTSFEAESGEGIGILNRAAFKGFMDFNNSYNGGFSSGGKYAGGGIITQAIRPDSANIDLSELQRSIANMKVQVAVEDINTGQGNYAEIVNGANV